MARAMTESSSPATRSGRSPQAGRKRRWPWAAGVLGAVLAIGPGLGPGSLLNLDLIFTPELRVPAGLWGLGPGLPQRVPVYLPQAWLSPLLGGPVAGKLVMVAAFAAAFAGVVRLAPGAPIPAQAGAAILYALGPYALTRASVGHLNVLALLAILPWALPVLLRPGDRLARTYLAALGLSLAGAPGGAAAALVLAVGLVFDRGRRTVAVAGAFLLSTLVWLVPSVSVLAAGAETSDAADFATRVDGVTGWARLLIGGGFWRPESELGASGWWVALLAVAVVALAALGHRDLPRPWGDRALAAGVMGLVLTVASAAPGLRGPYEAFTELPFGAPFRESQRSVLLWLAWMAPAAALGCARAWRALAGPAGDAGRGVRAVAAPLALALPAVGGLLVSAPGLWGAGGVYRPVEFPAGWAEAKGRIDASPGTVLALPWKEYLDISFAGGRRTFNPLPDYLGGDVVSSYDPEFGEPVQEQVDQRADVIDRLLPDLLLGRPQSAQFRELGVRWVVLTHESTARPPGSPELGVPGHSTWERYRPALVEDPGLDRTYTDASIDLYRVRGWTGPVSGEEGEGHDIGGLIRPLQRTDAPADSVWNTAGAPGWFRGLTPAEVTGNGLLALPGSGPVWFGPGFLVLGADGLVVATAIVAAWRLRRRPSSSADVTHRGD